MFSSSQSQVITNFNGINPTPLTDLNFTKVALLVKSIPLNGGQNNTFKDSSLNNLTITRTGNVTQGSYSPFNNQNGSIDFTNAVNVITSDEAFALGTTCSIEFWVYPTAQADGDWFQQNTTNVPSFGIHNGSIGIANTGDALRVSTGINPILNQWNHLAYIRDANQTANTSLYLNGTRIWNGGTNGPAFSYGKVAQMLIGGTWPGLMSNFRYVQGIAVYDTTATSIIVPTTSLTSVTGTKILIGKSASITNNSAEDPYQLTGAFTKSSKTPFPSETVTYSPDIHGSSIYFDGTGDGLTFPLNPAPLALAANDFTFEAWVYPTAGTGNKSVFCGQSNLSTVVGSCYVFYLSPTATSDIYYNGNNTLSITSPNPLLNQWSHVAWVRIGTSFKSYLNGILVGSGVLPSGAAVNLGLTNYASSIGQTANNGSPFTGFMSGVRLVNGTGLYSAQFVPARTPATAITNTAFLLSGSNFNIYDTSGNGDFETIGSAKADTTIVNYETSSVKFLAAGDYLRLKSSDQYIFNTGDFTYEAFVYQVTRSAVSGIFMPVGTGNTQMSLYITTTGKLIASTYSSIVLTGASVIPLNTWTHIALTVTGGFLKLWVNGVLDATVAFSYNLTENSMNIGGNQNFTTYTFLGNLEGARITKGLARYTANFTPPTSALPNH